MLECIQCDIPIGFRLSHQTGVVEERKRALSHTTHDTVQDMAMHMGHIMADSPKYHSIADKQHALDNKLVGNEATSQMRAQFLRHETSCEDDTTMFRCHLNMQKCII